LAPQLKKAIQTAYRRLYDENIQNHDIIVPKCTFCGAKIDDPMLEYTIGKHSFRSQEKTTYSNETRF